MIVALNPRYGRVVIFEGGVFIGAMIFSGIFNYWLSTGGIIVLINGKVDNNLTYIAVVIIYVLLCEIAPALAFSHSIAAF
jgi:hypothetical protein